MTFTEQKKKKRGKNGIRPKKYTTLYDKLPKMRKTNEIKTPHPGNGSKLDMDLCKLSIPLKNVSKLPTDTKVARPAEAMRSARALKHTASELENNIFEGARVYSLAEEKHAAFRFSGTAVSRLLTFVQSVDIDMQTLVNKNNPDPSTIQESDTTGGISFTLAINLHSVRDYFDMHDSLDYFKMPSLSPLRKLENVRNIAALPVNTTSSIFSISIERRCMVVKIICFKLNALCEQFWNTLATLSGKVVEASLSRNAPVLLFHNWHFLNITQGYLLKHLLDGSNIVTLNTMRKLFFVLITSPYPNLKINISLGCSKNGIFIALNPIPVREFSNNSMSWSKLHEAVWLSLMKPTSVDGNEQASKVYIRSSNGDTLANRSLRVEESDLNKVYSSYFQSDSESTFTHFSESNRGITEKRSVGTVCNLSYDETNLGTVSSRKEETMYNWKDVIYDSISKITSLREELKMGSLNFLRNKVRIAIPKISVERNNCFSRFCNGYINENLIFDAQALEDQYLDQFEPKEFCRVFLKSFGRMLTATVFSTII